MALGSGNIEIDVTTRVDTSGIVRQVNAAERQLQPLNLRLDDKGFRQPLGRISGDMAEFEKSLDASVARTLAFGAAVGVLNAVSKAFQGMVTSAAQVEKALMDINVILNLSSKSLAQFSEDLFEVAKNTGQAFESVSDAAVELSRQGLGAEETLRRINDAMILTRLSGMDAAKSVETLTAAVNSFGSTALTTTELVNKLATVDAAFAVSTEDLANALARAGSTAQGAKVSLDELLAAVTSVQQITARGGSVIGNAFKSIFTRIQRSSVREALEEIGVATTDATGNIRNAIDIIKDYAGVYKTLSDAQRSYTDELVAGVFQINNFKALVKDLSSDYSIYDRALKQSNSATDEAIRRNSQLQTTLSALMNEASVNVKSLAASLGELVATPAIENLLKIFNSFSGAIANALEGEGMIKTFLMGIGNFIAGPGLIIITVAFVKLFKFITGQATQAIGAIFNIGKAQNKIAEAESRIGFLLKSNYALYEAITNEALDHKQKEDLVLQTLKAQNQAYQQQQSLINSLSRSKVIQGQLAPMMAGGFVPSASRGFVPNFANGVEGAMMSEKRAIAQGAGGASKSARPKVIKNFPMGKGKKQTVVANTDEVIVPNYMGGSGSAIFNKKMVKKAGGKPKGAIPVSQGFVPNFAKGAFSFIGTEPYESVKDGMIANKQTVDVEALLGGIGMIVAAGPSGRVVKSTIQDPTSKGFLGAKGVRTIIDNIAGSKLNDAEKGEVIARLKKVAKVTYSDVGVSPIKEMSVSDAGKIAGTGGAIDDIIGPYIANATAAVSQKIYSSLFGDEVKSKQLVAEVYNAATTNIKSIATPSTEGSIFEAAVRLGSKASSVGFGGDPKAIWDFEETTNISQDLKEMYFDPIGYPNITRADAKRQASDDMITDVVQKAYSDKGSATWMRERLVQWHTQQYKPLVNAAVAGKAAAKATSSSATKAGGFIPNLSGGFVPNFEDRKPATNWQDIFTTMMKAANANPSINAEQMANSVGKNNSNFRTAMAGNRPDTYVPVDIGGTIVKGKVNMDTGAITWDSSEKIIPASTGTVLTKGQFEDLAGAYVAAAARGSTTIGTKNVAAGRSYEDVIGWLIGRKPHSGDIDWPVNAGINTANISDTSKWNQSPDSAGLAPSDFIGAGLNKMGAHGGGAPFAAATDASYAGHRAPTLISKTIRENLQSYLNWQAGGSVETYDSTSDFLEVTQKGNDKLGGVSQGVLYSGASTNLGGQQMLFQTDIFDYDNDPTLTSAIAASVKAGGFIPNFAKQGITDLDRASSSYESIKTKQWKTLKSSDPNAPKQGREIRQRILNASHFYPLDPKRAMMTMYRDVLEAGDTQRPYTDIEAGEIVGPRVPSILVRAKEILDRARSKGKNIPFMDIDGFFEPTWLMGTIQRKKNESQDLESGVSAYYYPGEEKDVEKYIKALGANPESPAQFQLANSPLLSNGFARGWIPNFQLNKAKGKIASKETKQLGRDLTDASIANKRPASVGDKYIINNKSPWEKYRGSNHDNIATANNLLVDGALPSNFIKTHPQTQQIKIDEEWKAVEKMIFASGEKAISNEAMITMKSLADLEDRVLIRDDSWLNPAGGSVGKEVIYDPLGQLGEPIFNQGFIPNFADLYQTYTSGPNVSFPVENYSSFFDNMKGADDSLASRLTSSRKYRKQLGLKGSEPSFSTRTYQIDDNNLNQLVSGVYTAGNLKKLRDRSRWFAKNMPVPEEDWDEDYYDRSADGYTTYEDAADEMEGRHRAHQRLRTRPDMPFTMAGTARSPLPLAVKGKAAYGSTYSIPNLGPGHPEVDGFTMEDEISLRDIFSPNLNKPIHERDVTEEFLDSMQFAYDMAPGTKNPDKALNAARQKGFSKMKDHSASGFIPNFMLIDALFPPPMRSNLPRYKKTATPDHISKKDPPKAREIKEMTVPRDYNLNDFDHGPDPTEYKTTGAAKYLYRHMSSLSKTHNTGITNGINDTMRAFHGDPPLRSFTSPNAINDFFWKTAKEQSINEEGYDSKSDLLGSYGIYELMQDEIDTTLMGKYGAGTVDISPQGYRNAPEGTRRKYTAAWPGQKSEVSGNYFADGLVPNFIRGLFDSDYLPANQGKSKDGIIDSIINGGLPFDVFHGPPGAGKSTLARNMFPHELIASLDHFEGMQDQWTEFSVVSGTQPSRGLIKEGAPQGLAQYTPRAQRILLGARKIFALTPDKKTLETRRATRMKLAELGKTDPSHLPDQRSAGALAAASSGSWLTDPDISLYDELEQMGKPVTRVANDGLIPNFAIKDNILSQMDEAAAYSETTRAQGRAPIKPSRARKLLGYIKGVLSNGAKWLTDRWGGMTPLEKGLFIGGSATPIPMGGEVAVQASRAAAKLKDKDFRKKLTDELNEYISGPKDPGNFNNYSGLIPNFEETYTVHRGQGYSREYTEPNIHDILFEPLLNAQTPEDVLRIAQNFSRSHASGALSGSLRDKGSGELADKFLDYIAKWRYTTSGGMEEFETAEDPYSSDFISRGHENGPFELTSGATSHSSNPKIADTFKDQLTQDLGFGPPGAKAVFETEVSSRNVFGKKKLLRLLNLGAKPPNYPMVDKLKTKIRDGSFKTWWADNGGLYLNLDARRNDPKLADLEDDMGKRPGAIYDQPIDSIYPKSERDGDIYSREQELIGIVGDNKRRIKRTYPSSNGLIPNFNDGYDRQRKHPRILRESSVERKTLDAKSLFPKSGQMALSGIIKDIIASAKAGDPYTDIQAGNIVGPRIPSLIVKSKKLIDSMRAKGRDIPKMGIEGILEPSHLIRAIKGRKREYDDRVDRAEFRREKFEPSKDINPRTGKRLSADYFPQEEMEVEQALRDLGADPNSDDLFSLQKSPLFAQGFAGGFVPNFAWKQKEGLRDSSSWVGGTGRTRSIAETSSFLNYKDNEIEFMQSRRKGDANTLFDDFLQDKGTTYSQTIGQNRSFKQGSKTNFEDLVYAFPQLQYRLKENATTTGDFVDGPNMKSHRFYGIKDLKSRVNKMDRTEFQETLGNHPGTPGMNVYTIGNLTTTRTDDKSKADNIYKDYARGLIPNFAKVYHGTTLANATSIMRDGQINQATLDPLSDRALLDAIFQRQGGVYWSPDPAIPGLTPSQALFSTDVAGSTPVFDGEFFTEAAVGLKRDMETYYALPLEEQDDAKDWGGVYNKTTARVDRPDSWEHFGLPEVRTKAAFMKNPELVRPLDLLEGTRSDDNKSTGILKKPASRFVPRGAGFIPNFKDGDGNITAKANFLKDLGLSGQFTPYQNDQSKHKAITGLEIRGHAGNRIPYKKDVEELESKGTRNALLSFLRGGDHVDDAIDMSANTTMDTLIGHIPEALDMASTAVLPGLGLVIKSMINAKKSRNAGDVVSWLQSYNQTNFLAGLEGSRDNLFRIPNDTWTGVGDTITFPAVSSLKQAIGPSMGEMSKGNENLASIAGRGGRIAARGFIPNFANKLSPPSNESFFIPQAPGSALLGNEEYNAAQIQNAIRDVQLVTGASLDPRGVLNMAMNYSAEVNKSKKPFEKTILNKNFDFDGDGPDGKPFIPLHSADISNALKGLELLGYKKGKYAPKIVGKPTLSGGPSKESLFDSTISAMHGLIPNFAEQVSVGYLNTIAQQKRGSGVDEKYSDAKGKIADLKSKIEKEGFDPSNPLKIAYDPFAAIDGDIASFDMAYDDFSRGKMGRLSLTEGNHRLQALQGKKSILAEVIGAKLWDGKGRAPSALPESIKSQLSETFSRFFEMEEDSRGEMSVADFEREVSSGVYDNNIYGKIYGEYEDKRSELENKLVDKGAITPGPKSPKGMEIKADRDYSDRAWDVKEKWEKMWWQDAYTRYKDKINIDKVKNLENWVFGQISERIEGTWDPSEFGVFNEGFIPNFAKGAEPKKIQPSKATDSGLQLSPLERNKAHWEPRLKPDDVSALFPGYKSLGIGRASMPQFDDPAKQELLFEKLRSGELTGTPVSVTTGGVMSAKAVRGTQDEIVGPKIKKHMEGAYGKDAFDPDAKKTTPKWMSGRTIMVGSKGRILDGHHSAFAQKLRLLVDGGVGKSDYGEESDLLQAVTTIGAPIDSFIKMLLPGGKWANLSDERKAASQNEKLPTAPKLKAAGGLIPNFAKGVESKKVQAISELLSLDNQWIKAVQSNGDLGSTMGLGAGGTENRETMPQVSKDNEKDFIRDLESGTGMAGKMLGGKPIAIAKGGQIPVNKLQATQKDIYASNVFDKLIGAYGNDWDKPGDEITKGAKPWLTQPIMISKGKKILDGHHRWATLYARDAIEDGVIGNVNMKVTTLGTDIQTLLQLSDAYSGAKHSGAGTAASEGLIPNFADALQAAIGREKAALKSQGSNAKVYVDQDNRLKGPRNPGGLLVANKRDEPRSGSQGVNRAIANRMDPKRHGAARGMIPNFIGGAGLQPMIEKFNVDQMIKESNKLSMALNLFEDLPDEEVMALTEKLEILRAKMHALSEEKISDEQRSSAVPLTREAQSNIQKVTQKMQPASLPRVAASPLGLPPEPPDLDAVIREINESVEKINRSANEFDIDDEEIAKEIDKAAQNINQLKTDHKVNIEKAMETGSLKTIDIQDEDKKSRVQDFSSSAGKHLIQTSDNATKAIEKQAKAQRKLERSMHGSLAKIMGIQMAMSQVSAMADIDLTGMQSAMGIFQGLESVIGHETMQKMNKFKVAGLGLGTAMNLGAMGIGLYLDVYNNFLDAEKLAIKELDKEIEARKSEIDIITQSIEKIDKFADAATKFGDAAKTGDIETAGKFMQSFYKSGKDIANLDPSAFSAVINAIGDTDKFNKAIDDFKKVSSLGKDLKTVEGDFASMMKGVKEELDDSQYWFGIGGNDTLKGATEDGDIDLSDFEDKFKTIGTTLTQSLSDEKVIELSSALNGINIDSETAAGTLLGLSDIFGEFNESTKQNLKENGQLAEGILKQIKAQNDYNAAVLKASKAFARVQQPISPLNKSLNELALALDNVAQSSKAAFDALFEVGDIQGKSNIDTMKATGTVSESDLLGGQASAAIQNSLEKASQESSGSLKAFASEMIRSAKEGTTELSDGLKSVIGGIQSGEMSNESAIKALLDVQKNGDPTQKETAQKTIQELQKINQSQIKDTAVTNANLRAQLVALDTQAVSFQRNNQLSDSQLKLLGNFDNSLKEGTNTEKTSLEKISQLAEVMKTIESLGGDPDMLAEMKEQNKQLSQLENLRQAFSKITGKEFDATGLKELQRQTQDFNLEGAEGQTIALFASLEKGLQTALDFESGVKGKEEVVEATTIKFGEGELDAMSSKMAEAIGGSLSAALGIGPEVAKAISAEVDIDHIARTIEDQSIENTVNAEKNAKSLQDINSALLSSLKGLDLKQPATALEAAAKQLNIAADKMIEANSAAGFVPNFAPTDSVSRALSAEKRLGAKRPVVDSHPSIGTYVRDAETQPTFGAVKRDHPEGLKQASENSRATQSAINANAFMPETFTPDLESQFTRNANGLVPNFAKEKAPNEKSSVNEWEKAFGKSDKRKRVDEYLAGGGKTRMQASNFPGWGSIKDEIYRQTGLEKENPLRSGYEVNLDYPPYKVLGGGTIGAFDPTSEKVWLSEFPTKDTPMKALSDIQSVLANETIHWIQNKYEKELGKEDYQQWIATKFRQQDDSLGGVGFGPARYAESFKDIGYDGKSGAHVEFLKGKKFSEQEMLKRFNLDNLDFIPSLKELMEKGTPAEAWLLNDLVSYAPRIMHDQEKLWKGLGLTHQEPTGIKEISGAMSGGISRGRDGYLLEKAQTNWPKFRKTGDPLDLELTKFEVGSEANMILNDPDFRDLWFDEHGNSKFLKDPMGTLKGIESEFGAESMKPLYSLINDIQKTNKKNKDTGEDGYSEMHTRITDVYNSSISKLLQERMSHMASIGVRNLQKEQGGLPLRGISDVNKFSGFADGFVPNFAPMNPVSRALSTERGMGAKRPVVDSHPSVGTYVRDAATQPNFGAVKRDHPEGLRRASRNSRAIQSVTNARGHVPNFAPVRQTTEETELLKRWKNDAGFENGTESARRSDLNIRKMNKESSSTNVTRVLHSLFGNPSYMDKLDSNQGTGWDFVDSETYEWYGERLFNKDLFQRFGPLVDAEATLKSHKPTKTWMDSMKDGTSDESIASEWFKTNIKSTAEGLLLPALKGVSRGVFDQGFDIDDQIVSVLLSALQKQSDKYRARYMWGWENWIEASSFATENRTLAKDKILSSVLQEVSIIDNEGTLKSMDSVVGDQPFSDNGEIRKPGKGLAPLGPNLVLERLYDGQAVAYDFFGSKFSGDPDTLISAADFIAGGMSDKDFKGPITPSAIIDYSQGKELNSLWQNMLTSDPAGTELIKRKTLTDSLSGVVKLIGEGGGGMTIPFGIDPANNMFTENIPVDYTHGQFEQLGQKIQETINTIEGNPEATEELKGYYKKWEEYNTVYTDMFNALEKKEGEGVGRYLNWEKNPMYITAGGIKKPPEADLSLPKDWTSDLGGLVNFDVAPHANPSTRFTEFQKKNKRMLDKLTANPRLEGTTQEFVNRHYREDAGGILMDLNKKVGKQSYEEVLRSLNEATLGDEGVDEIKELEDKRKSDPLGLWSGDAKRIKHLKDKQRAGVDKELLGDGKDKGKIFEIEEELKKNLDGVNDGSAGKAEELKNERSQRQTKIEGERDRLYLALMGKKLEERRGSAGANKLLELERDLAAELPNYKKGIDQSLIPRRERIIATAERNPMTRDRKGIIIGHNQNIINQLQELSSIYGDPARGIAYHMFRDKSSLMSEKYPDEYPPEYGRVDIFDKAIFNAPDDYMARHKAKRAEFFLDDWGVEEALSGDRDAALGQQKMEDILSSYQEKNYFGQNINDLLNYAQIQQQVGNYGESMWMKFFKGANDQQQKNMLNRVGLTEKDQDKKLDEGELIGIFKTYSDIFSGTKKGFFFESLARMSPVPNQIAESIKSVGIPLNPKDADIFNVGDQFLEKDVTVMNAKSVDGSGSSVRGVDSYSVRELKKQIVDYKIANFNKGGDKGTKVAGLPKLPGNPHNPLESTFGEILEAINQESIDMNAHYLNYLLSSGGEDKVGGIMEEMIADSSGVTNTEGWDKKYGPYGVPSSIGLFSGDLNNNYVKQDDLLSSLNEKIPIREVMTYQGAETPIKLLASSIIGAKMVGANPGIEEMLAGIQGPNPFSGILGGDPKPIIAEKTLEEVLKSIKTESMGKVNYAPYGYDRNFLLRNGPAGEPDQLALFVKALRQAYLDEGDEKNAPAAAAAAPAAGGFVPNFSKIAGEIAASKTAGYKTPVRPSQVKSMSIAGVGKTSYNTQESVFKAKGMSQPFIRPPANSKAAKPYAKKVQKKFNFNPYGKQSADGFVPNFFQGPTSSQFEEAAKRFSSSVGMFERSGSSLGEAFDRMDFTKFSDASNNILEASKEFAVQSGNIKDAADSLRGGEPTQGVNQAEINFEPLTKASGEISSSVSALSEQLRTPLTIDASGLSAVVKTMQNIQLSVNVPSVDVNVQGVAGAADQIKQSVGQEVENRVKALLAEQSFVTATQINSWFGTNFS